MLYTHTHSHRLAATAGSAGSQSQLAVAGAVLLPPPHTHTQTSCQISASLHSRLNLWLCLLVSGGDRGAQAKLNLRSSQPKSLPQYLYSKKMVLITHGYFCSNFPQPYIFLYCRFWVIRLWPRPSGSPDTDPVCVWGGGERERIMTSYSGIWPTEASCVLNY